MTAFSPDLAPPHDVLAFVGAFGSGKTETCLNYAVHLAGQGRTVTVADLDIVNPYFRSRTAAEELAASGVRTLMPPGEQRYAELPIIVPEVRAAILQPAGVLLLDIGGDDLGARVLGHLEDALDAHGVHLLQVVNTSRPFTETIDGCRRMQAQLEAASRQRVAGYVANTHLMQYTDSALILAGVALVERLAAETGLPLAFATVAERLATAELRAALPIPILPLRRFMLKPWQKVGARPIGVPVLDLPELD